MGATSELAEAPGGPALSLPVDPVHLVLRDFRVLIHAARVHFANTRKTTGLSGAQVWALSEIERSPGIRLTRLARTLSVHQTTASNLVNDLLREKLVEKIADADDARSINLRTTTEGTALLLRSPFPYAGILPDALKSLTTLQITALHSAMRPLLKQLGAETVERYALTPMSNMLDANAASTEP